MGGMKDLFKAYRKVEDLFVLAEMVERIMKPMTMRVQPVMSFAKAQAQLVGRVNQRVVGVGALVSAAGSGGGRATVESVATGGSRSTSITINLKSLVEKIVFEGGMGESRGDMERQVSEALLQVLNMAQASVS